MKDKILAEVNVEILMRARGKIVDRREGHNVLTITGQNWLSKLVGWSTFGNPDVPFTQRRVRWVGVGTGTQLEVSSVEQLNLPILVSGSNYITALDSVEFPTSTSARFIKEFAAGELSITTPVVITEAGLFADVSTPATYGAVAGSEDGAGASTLLLPTISTNPPVAYKAFEGITKTQDFTMEIRWDFRF